MYIDPNTGGQLFQILAASLAVLSGGLLMFSSQIRAFFAKMRRKGREDKEETKE
jgi:hypothetical protein